WTGIDFVDDEQLDAHGDGVDAARAATWWRLQPASWTAEALYRGGQALELLPVVDALARGSA
ncbi:MAG TPA: hypothetical protein PKD61_36450, partial [Polyangiaceae bacterium]|nr:hypothetical protein [Polyangiaceae bacterium]